MTLDELIAARPTPAEFIAAHRYFNDTEYREKTHCSPNSLKYHLKNRKLVSVRRGTYVSPIIADWPDPYLLGSRLVADIGIIAYTTALHFHLGDPKPEHVIVVSDARLDRFEHLGVVYQAVKQPHPLDPYRLSGDCIRDHERSNIHFYVHTLERAIVDCLHRLDLGPGLELLWKLLWKLLSARNTLDWSAMIQHALALGDRVTIARFGGMLAHHPRFSIKSPEVRELLAHKPSSPAMMDPRANPSDCMYDARWRLRVPSSLHRLMSPGWRR
ncbi:MAG: hypothetical protein JNK82_22220 [Myxococcaceae bacterium]|nr:hypothetical protein [Myxococcaceae bacterium]